jgi:hypothetical protein
MKIKHLVITITAITIMLIAFTKDDQAGELVSETSTTTTNFKTGYAPIGSGLSGEVWMTSIDQHNGKPPICGITAITIQKTKSEFESFSPFSFPCSRIDTVIQVLERFRPLIQEKAAGKSPKKLLARPIKASEPRLSKPSK